MTRRRGSLLTGALLGALLLTGCSDAGLSDSAARELQQQVAVVRAAAERHDVTAAEQQLTDLRAALDRQVAADQVDPERAAEITAAADLVAARLDLLGADEQPEAEPPPPPPPEDHDEDHDDDEKEKEEEDDEKEKEEKEDKEDKEDKKEKEEAAGDGGGEEDKEDEEDDGRGPAGEGPPGQSRAPGPPDTAGGSGP